MVVHQMSFIPSVERGWLNSLARINLAPHTLSFFSLASHLSALSLGFAQRNAMAAGLLPSESVSVSLLHLHVHLVVALYQVIAQSFHMRLAIAIFPNQSSGTSTFER
jgi:Kef-type K+ transport system membrane component KefB